MASHAKPREDILAVADASFAEPNDTDLGPIPGCGYGEWVEQVAKHRDVAAVLCTRHREALSDLRGRFASFGVRLATGASTSENAFAVENKDVFAKRIEGIAPLPRTKRVDGAEEFVAALKEFDDVERLCVKPVNGIFGRGFLQIDPKAGLLDALTALHGRSVSSEVLAHALASAKNPEPMLLMEYLPGEEYSIDMVCDDGRVIAAVSRHKTAHYQIIETRGPQVEIARAVAAEMRLDGIVNVQTRGGADGRQNILEANARIAGGVAYSAPAGVNLPAIWARHATGRSVIVKHLAEPVAVRINASAFALPETSALLSSATTETAA
ncbi:ATP-grasp domain-containing protein [Chenggangzhangella methanolivorans]|uniref:ATP-grasp domain-containing protein n=1 Tax=Chenggangzhangella methanolivorans TaxID=1437009 RepID=A0A9E6UN42_9HYPH|nr:ATP-grasp domain-containing protein [Chenggangzhangella methanolivorans]QZO00646.1 ATP-grasp domain-containing protein [Chenggangzhangella methanolivorans]